jgi:hypothetical protein
MATLQRHGSDRSNGHYRDAPTRVGPLDDW